MTRIHATRRTLPGWLAGLVAATGTLIALWFVTIAFFVSIPGLAIAGAIAIAFGSGIAAMADPPHAQRHAAVVAWYVVALAAAYLLLAQAAARRAPPGATGGAGVDLPRGGGGPGVYPPSR
jgi:hypothetical protein